MKITELKSFLEIVSVESFSKAAANLHYAHSSVTAQIKSLESHLGEQLFYRDNQSVTLTEAGKRLHPFARKIIDISREAKYRVNETPRLSGELIIAAVETVSTYRLPKLLKRIQQSAPNVHVSFRVMGDKEIIDGVKSGTLDFGFLVEEKLLEPDIEVAYLCREPVSLFVEPNHVLAKSKRVSAKDLAKEHHLLWSLGCSYSDVFNNIMQRAGFHDYSYTEFSNTESIKHCAMEGLGIATLTDITAVKELAAGEIIKLNFPIPNQFSSIMFWNKNRESFPVLNHFIQQAAKHFGFKK